MGGGEVKARFGISHSILPSPLSWVMPIRKSQKTLKMRVQEVSRDPLALSIASKYSKTRSKTLNMQKVGFPPTSGKKTPKKCAKPHKKSANNFVFFFSPEIGGDHTFCAL